jgi:hypothetical protein
MTRFGWIVLFIALLVIAGIMGGWYLIMRYHLPAVAVAPVATTTPETDLSSSSIYTNGVYGFSVVYPAKDAESETFTPWRAGAVATGTPLVQFADADGTIRIGASGNAKEVKACTKVGPAETALPDMQLGSTTFKAFTRDDMGTDNQERITSYRAVHENACVAIETFQPLSAAGAVASSTSIQGIVQSFTFARS